MESEACISRSGGNRIKVEYVKEGKRRIGLWETNSKGTLETQFDGNGHILVQRALALSEKELDERVYGLLKDAGISSTRETEYSDVGFDKPCPNCNAQELSRYVEAFSTKGEVPVMPLYYCGKCKAKSYYLTNEYLEYMVENNRHLFSDAEISEMDSDMEKFMGELRSYIIRIFASKKVMCIK